jgi:RND family efflux transporter MFP subunit
VGQIEVMNPPPRQDRELYEEDPKPPSAGKGRKAGFAVAALILILVIAGVITVASKVGEKKALAAETERLATPTVTLVRPTLEQSHEELILPATVQAFKESPIYARTNGYILHWYKDMGSRVKQGDKLADIDTPEVDQELLQARAARQQSEAQLQLAKISAERWQNLRKSDSVSQQEADQQVSGYAQAQANLAAADANVRRLQNLESFKHIYAPFSGVLTKRNIDVGALINAGSSPNQQLFNVAQVDPLRVYINVPQSYSPAIHVGMKAYLDQNEYAGEKFEGKVVRTADSIDPATRTLLTEVQIPNPTGKILTGAYAQIHFAAHIEAPRLTVPINTLLFRAEGPQAAVVGPDNKVQLKPIKIGRDYGSAVEVVQGLQPDDQLVVNPPDSLEDGEQVNIAKPGNGQKQGGGKKG